MKRTLALVAPIIIVLIIGFFLILNQPRTPLSQPKPVPSPKITQSISLYDQKNLGFSLRLPDGFRAENNGTFSRLIARAKQDSVTGNTGFIYISVIPKGAAAEAGEIYNYNQKDIQTLTAMQIGEKTTLGVDPASEQAKYFTYEKIEGTMLGGYGAKAYLNKSPWEFPQGTQEYRYLVEFEEALFLIGYYVQKNPSSNSMTKPEADRILSTLKLTPASVVNDFSKPVGEGEWKNFTSTGYKISFSYPSGWEIAENSQNFENGDIFAIRVIGQTQRTQTELYDGASFAVMKPLSTDKNLSQWVKDKYSDSELSPERPPQFEKVAFGEITYEKIIVCGLGCFTYYHTLQNNLIYGFVFIAEGPHKAQYESAVSRVMSSVKYSK